MKVAHVITSVDAGGAETALYKLLAAQRGSGRDACVISFRGMGPIGDRIQALGIPVTALGMRPGRPSAWGLARLVRILRGEHPDLVQTWLYHADLLGGVVARTLGIPVVWGVRHGDLGHRDKAHTRWTRRLCASLSRSVPSKIVCNSEASIRIHVGAGYAPEKFVHIPNGFDLSRFRPDPDARAALRRQLGIAAETPVAGLVARHHPHKDHATFFAAAASIRARSEATRFVLCGEGLHWQNGEITRLIDESLRPAVHLLGRRDDVERIYPALDVACLSSATESFPNVLGEAMACGVPCVSTDCGDVRELISDTGRVVPTRDPEALAAAALEVLTLEPSRRDALGVAARARVTEHYDIRTVAHRFSELQDEVVERTSRRSTS